jgi:hypothetical protein
MDWLIADDKSSSVACQSTVVAGVPSCAGFQLLIGLEYVPEPFLGIYCPPYPLRGTIQAHTIGAYMPFKNPHPLYTCWRSMIGRCESRKNKAFIDYGARGITVCARWGKRGGEGFRNFVADMGDRPQGYSLERKNNELGYFPENCKWATRSEQQLNRRVTVFVTIEGKSYKAAELAKKVGIKTDCLIARVKKGLSYEEVMRPEKRVYKEGLAFGAKARGAMQKAKTHCPHGHEYSPENTSYSPLGHRGCKKCHAQREAARRIKKAKDF